MPAEPIATVTEQFAPISLEEVNARAALQIRVDCKYILPWPRFEAFIERLRATHSILEIDGRRVFSYDTLYFDTASLLTYREHVQGRRKRFKARSRLYVESGLCLFEVKLKGRRGETIKKKLVYDRALHGTLTIEARAFLDQCLLQGYGLAVAEPLAPTLGTCYRRLTLLAREATERVTCDLDLQFVGAAGERRAIAEGCVLIETKAKQEGGPTDRLLWRMGVRPVSGSKYCLGVGLLYPGVCTSPYRRQLRRYFGWDGAAPPPLPKDVKVVRCG
jgi:hypothetical protein